jgi:predicted O-methyltransferase YrrM
VTRDPVLQRTPAEVIEIMVADRPIFHTRDTDGSWTADTSTLRMLARHLEVGDRTLEVGCGASTVVFAAAGASHTAISPDSREHVRVREYCERLGVDHAAVTFVAGYSDLVLPGLDLDRPLDVAFIDGDHSFPYPVIDWHYINRHLAVGGILLVDDLHAASTGVISRNMLGNPNWDLLEVVGLQAGAFRKLGHQLTFDLWLNDPFNRVPDYSFLGRGGALRQHARDRFAELKGRVATRLPAVARAYRGVKRRR